MDPLATSVWVLAAFIAAVYSGRDMPVARREVTKSGDSFCKKVGDEDLLADKKVSPE